MYVTSTKKQKMMISRSIVDKVRTQLVPPGRFLEKDTDTGLWYEVDVKKALEKTAQRLRDLAGPLRKQLSEDFSDPSFLSAVFDGANGIGITTPGATPLNGGASHRGHRRNKTAPARDLVLPPDCLPPSPKKMRESPMPQAPQSVSPLYSNFAALSLPPELSLETNQNQHGNKSANSNKAQHRRSQTFGGYSCSDSNAAELLSKEDLMAAIPPLFASHLPESAQQAVAQALHPLSSPGQHTSPGHKRMSSLPSARRHGHRRHNTVDSFQLSQNNPIVFSDDPTLTFDFDFLNNGNKQAPRVDSVESNNSSQNSHPFNAPFEIPNTLTVPDLPDAPPPRANRGRHRRTRTTGDLGFGSMGGGINGFRSSLPLDPVQEEQPPSIESIVNTLQPIHHDPNKTAHEVHPSSSSLEGILSALDTIAEDHASERSRGGSKSSKDTSLSNCDFMAMLQSEDEKVQTLFFDEHHHAPIDSDNHAHSNEGVDQTSFAAFARGDAGAEEKSDKGGMDQMSFAAFARGDPGAEDKDNREGMDQASFAAFAQGGAEAEDNGHHEGMDQASFAAFAQGGVEVEGQDVRGEMDQSSFAAFARGADEERWNGQGHVENDDDGGIQKAMGHDSHFLNLCNVDSVELDGDVVFS